ncbi:probable phospholipid-transporting ATPase 8 [Salvia miltiorrhiza]|uniref:probable phospholipid-transporting ATPase 8 n=1 Tax=Salvia miltiorrhiza TaxID=226208 RepID=UPI0025AD596D|nr:probable phospholipid-transporting ATPase 8 [Salvia miltiorrhiza]
MASPRKKVIRFSRLYSFSCFRSSFGDEHSQIGLKGYSRVVYCNDPDNPEQILPRYPSNYVSTTKYTAINFIPKSLFEQFRRVANIYFLVVACVSYSPLAPYSAYSVLLPLMLVIGATIVKEAIEDWRRRKQDIEANNRKVEVYDRNHGFQIARWKKLRVGDLVKVHKDEHFPADMLLLSSSYEDGICYVETTNLDGETNLKVKHALDVTSNMHEDDSFKHFKAVIKCEDPNEDLYSFVGTFYHDGQQYPVSLQQFLLRDSKLRNTEYVYGVVVFTDHDTKVMQNAIEPPSKRSKIERKMDKIVYVLFSLLVLVSLIGSFFFGIMTENDIDDDGELRRWYLRPDQTTAFYDPNRSALAAFLHFLTALMLYGYLIPISLYVSIELVKVLQVIFINQDIDMYHEETDGPATAKTSNLNEELGLVDTILSDKTGTLTCNSMEFVKCSIAGVAYGSGLTEVERVLAKRRGDALDDSEVTSSTSIQSDDGMAPGKSVKGFNFHDDRIMNGQWVNEPRADMIQKFFRVLALCHTAIPEVNEEKEILYEAESPDEAAFVISARELGFEMYERTQSHISLRELDHESNQKIDRPYELLHVLEFSSNRRRMSVIVRNVENQLLLLSKGSDGVMLERLSENSQDFVAVTMDHVKRYAEAGLRTLVLAYRELSKEEFSLWEKEFLNAKATIGIDRDALIEAAADKIERDLILLGATAVEDKLQKGVPECIEKLEKAGIKIWVITGDKMETAINIGYACSLLREDMEQIVITLESPEMTELEKKGDKEAVAKASRESIANQIRRGTRLLSSSGGRSALIIDGKSLTFVLSQNLEDPFLHLAINCASVICCRSTPKQKALVTRLVKKGTGRTTLAIGDGANDVGMIQEADIGVGISGVEGMQAAMSSDFAIAQFRYLERLLLVHGHWCYRRISMMVCYFFYKNIAFGFTLFWFEAYASFSGQPAYNDWYMSCYNVFFTSLPVIALGVFDQDVSPRLCLKNPELYKEGIQDILFSWPRILGWILNGIICSVVVFFFTTSSAVHQAFRGDGQVLDFEMLGVYMYSCVVWTVNCQMALSINYFTWMQHLVIWGSIAVWYAFLLIYGAFPPLFSTTAYQVFIEACGPSPFFWLGTLLVVVSCLLPYLLYRTVQTWFFPMPHDIIQLWQRGTSDDRNGKLREKDTLLCK